MLRKSAGNMFEFIDYTFNPIKGECKHKCSYCYMNRYPKGKVYLDNSFLNKPFVTNQRIMLVSGTDMFASDVKTEWIKEVLDFLIQYPNEYLFHTKNPQRYHEFIKLFPKNSILGVTIETNRQDLISSEAPTIKERVNEMQKINLKKTITFEPIIDFDTSELINIINKVKPAYISIGADSGYNKLKEPNKEKIQELITQAKKITEVRLKHNIKRILE